ncbi:response regulator [candidate division KSB1 bacterium]|nr:response regulator [bacterium]OQX60662.1 MAG: hypothetical protein B5M50_00435 [candidate division KSB1 bacterium 4484_219]RKY79169.1 MAG: response regulator [candidate division KSB1 bacterium]HDI52445.1 response regulator [Bacteroidota bacterium]RKY79411.1 MAG: response regulator [candidate division KSB1 bacterium]
METNHKISILVVEDNLDHIELMVKALQKSSRACEIKIARDGQEALEILGLQGKGEKTTKKYIPQLIMLDIRLPKLDGEEVLRKIRNDPRLKLVPVVVLTTSARDDEVKRMYELGANSYIVKPSQFEEFLERIQHIETYWGTINVSPTKSVSFKEEQDES